LRESRIELHFAEMKDPVKDKLKRFELLERFGPRFSIRLWVRRRCLSGGSRGGLGTLRRLLNPRRVGRRIRRKRVLGRGGDTCSGFVPGNSSNPE